MHIDSNLFVPPTNNETVRIIPMGGCGEFGMNLTAYLYGGRLIVVDCGVRFPDPTKLGIDSLIPHVDEWFANAGGVYAYFITHGHEDHIGALPHVLKRWPAPIYATPWTVHLIKNKLQRFDMPLENFAINVVEAGDRISTPGLEVEYVHLNHSIPMACALFIRTPQLKIFHTGDFKFDKDPVIEAPYDSDYLRKLGNEGVDLMLADSTNAEKPGFCPGEKSVEQALLDASADVEGAVIYTTFASNLWRLVTMIEVSRKLGRKVLIAGRGVENTLAVAKATNLYFPPENVLISDSMADSIPRNELTVIATGCQGESRASMMRLAWGEHRSVSIRPGDYVFLSSRIIPGNERPVIHMIDRLKRLGATVVTTREKPDIHVSGHAYQGEVQELQSLLRPKCFLPVHGGFSQLKANQVEIEGNANSIDQSFVIETGDIIDLDTTGVTHCGKIEVDVSYIDSDSHVVLSYEALRERLRIGESGSIYFSAILSRERAKWLKPPQINLHGVRLPDDIDEEDFINRVVAEAHKQVKTLVKSGMQDEDVLSERVRIAVRRSFSQILNKKPVVIIHLYCV